MQSFEKGIRRYIYSGPQEKKKVQCVWWRSGDAVDEFDVEDLGSLLPEVLSATLFLFEKQWVT